VNRLLLGILFVTVGVQCEGSIILSVDPSSQAVPLGSQANFNLDISGLGNGTALETYDINLGFDPTLLSYSSVVFGTQVDISGLGDIQLVTPGSGTIEVFELSLDSPGELNSLQASSFTLATLSFDTLAAGTNSPVTLSINALGDAVGNSIAAIVQNGSVTINTPVSNVPEPSMRWLALCVVAVPILIALRRRSLSAV
jgi:hypothetical protein